MALKFIDECMALADDVKRRKAVFLDFRSSRQIGTETEQLLKPFLFDHFD